MFDVLILRKEQYLHEKGLSRLVFDMVIVDQDLSDSHKFWKKYSNSLKLILYKSG